jgi:hypothetical protein
MYSLSISTLTYRKLTNFLQCSFSNSCFAHSFKAKLLTNGKLMNYPNDFSALCNYSQSLCLCTALYFSVSTVSKMTPNYISFSPINMEVSLCFSSFFKRECSIDFPISMRLEKLEVFSKDWFSVTYFSNRYFPFSYAFASWVRKFAIS